VLLIKLIECPSHVSHVIAKYSETSRMVFKLVIEETRWRYVIFVYFCGNEYFGHLWIDCIGLYNR